MQCRSSGSSGHYSSDCKEALRAAGVACVVASLLRGWGTRAPLQDKVSAEHTLLAASAMGEDRFSRMLWSVPFWS